MKRLIQLCGMAALLILSVPLVTMGANATNAVTEFKNSKFKINLAYSGDWKPVTANGNCILKLLNKDNVSNISVLIYTVSPQVTINGFCRVRQNSLFNGWMDLGHRPGTDVEIAMANAQSSALAVYKKEILDAGNKLDKSIIAEYYYLKKNYGYIISINTRQNLWPALQTSLATTLDSFWIGTGKRPARLLLDKLGTDWEMIGKNPKNQNNIEAIIKTGAPKEVAWELVNAAIASVPGMVHYPGVISNNAFYFACQDRVFAVNLDNGQILWNFQLDGSVVRHLVIQKDILYFIVRTKDKNILYATMAQDGSILFRHSIEGNSFSHIIAVKDSLLLYDGTMFKSINAVTGELLWSHKYMPDTRTYPLVSGNVVYAVDTFKTVSAVNVKDGSLLWKANLPVNIVYSPVLYQNLMVLVSKSETPTSPYPVVAAWDTVSRTVKWDSSNMLAGFNRVSQLATAGNLVFLVAHKTAELEKDVVSDFIVLEGGTGKIVYRHEIGRLATQAYFPPIATSTGGYVLNLKDNAESGNVDVFLTGYSVLTQAMTSDFLFSFKAVSPEPRFMVRLYKDEIILQKVSNPASLKVFR